MSAHKSITTAWGETVNKILKEEHKRPKDEYLPLDMLFATEARYQAAILVCGIDLFLIQRNAPVMNSAVPLMISYRRMLGALLITE